MVSVALTRSSELGVVVPKPSDLVTSLTLQSGENIPDLYMFTLNVCINIILTKDKTCQANSLIGTYIYKISKLPALH